MVRPCGAVSFGGMNQVRMAVGTIPGATPSRRDGSGLGRGANDCESVARTAGCRVGRHLPPREGWAFPRFGRGRLLPFSPATTRSRRPVGPVGGATASGRDVATDEALSTCGSPFILKLPSVFGAFTFSSMLIHLRELRQRPRESEESCGRRARGRRATPDKLALLDMVHAHSSNVQPFSRHGRNTRSTSFLPKSAP